MATIKKRPNGTYQVTVRKKGHPPIYKTFEKKVQAQTWAREVESSLDSGAFVDFRLAEKTLVVDALDRYQEEITPTKKSQRTEKAAIANLKAGFAHRVLASVHPKDVAAYGAARQEGDEAVSADTVRRELQVLSEVFETARALWRINCINPVPEARKMMTRRRQLPPGVRRDRRLFAGELERLVSVPHKMASDIAALIEFAVETAMRREEIFEMRREHLNRKDRTLTIPKSKTDHQTGKQGRVIPLAPRALAILQGLPARLDGRVWMYTGIDSITQGFQRTVNQARRAYEKECQQTKTEPDAKLLRDLRFHDLRHEATSRLFELGLSLHEVAAITGHEDWDSLKRYTHLRPVDLAEKLAASVKA